MKLKWALNALTKLENLQDINILSVNIIIRIEILSVIQARTQG